MAVTSGDIVRKIYFHLISKVALTTRGSKERNVNRTQVGLCT